MYNIKAIQLKIEHDAKLILAKYKYTEVKVLNIAKIKEKVSIISKQYMMRE